LSIGGKQMEYWRQSDGALEASRWSIGGKQMEYWGQADGVLEASRWSTRCMQMEHLDQRCVASKVKAGN